MSINVYGVDDDNEVIYPSTLVPDRHVDLLLFERYRVHHYATIMNFSRLVGRQLSSHGHCFRRCLHAYSSQELVDAHALDCCHAQRKKFPKDPRCLPRAPPMQLCIQAGEQCVIGPLQASCLLHGRGCWGDVCAQTARRSGAFVSRVRCYSSTTASAYRDKTVLLPHCHQLLAGDKVRDHCHIVGNYLGVAHSSCNLAYRISKPDWKLPVVIHNLKGYDVHLIAKALKSEFGEVKVIPQYLFITVDRLKFIDSLQFTSQILDSLVKTLEVGEFEYLREAFPIAHEFELIKRKGVYP